MNMSERLAKVIDKEPPLPNINERLGKQGFFFNKYHI